VHRNAVHIRASTELYTNKMIFRLFILFYLFIGRMIEASSRGRVCSMQHRCRPCFGWIRQ